MSDMATGYDAKEHTRRQWGTTPCGTGDFLRGLQVGSLEYFDAIARRRYEVTDPWIKRTIPFGAAKGKKVLEIGHGIGTDLLTFAEAGADVYGIDITEEHHRLAKMNFEVHGREVDLRLCDAADICFSAGEFDIVYSLGVLHHTPETVRCIGEAYRVLKPGGMLLLALYNKYSAFHILVKVLLEGVAKGKLLTLGYDGLMATVESGADGRTTKPLVKTYSRCQMKTLLSDFSRTTLKVAHFSGDHVPLLGRVLKPSVAMCLEPWLGWYVVAMAQK